LDFAKSGENYYKATYNADKQGIQNLFGAQMAVNYPLEYENLGLNPELRDLVTVTGGKVFSLNDTDEIIEFVQEKSKRKKMETVHYRWPLIIAALFLFLVEVCIRRIKENRNIYKRK
jgi:hypothetical protein